MKADHEPIVVWCGRMNAADGYGAAARSQVKAMRQARIPHVAVDTASLKPFGSYDESRISLTKRGKLLSVGAIDASAALVAVVHDRPDRFSTVAVRGRSRRIGYSYFEAATLPPGWAPAMVSMDEMWTASEHNRQQFVAAGVPAWMTRVLHHPVDVDRSISGYDRRPSWGDKTVFLTSTSGLQRRDLRVLFEAFSEAFDTADDVLLVIKARRAEREQVQDAFLSTVMANPTRRSGTWPAVEIIEADLTREQMLRLHAAADVYVSTERGNGWCLPAIDSMALGVPVVAFDWGGSTEFISDDDCYVVPVAQHLVYGRDAIQVPNAMYDDHLWPAVDPLRLADALRAVMDQKDRRRRGEEASKRITALMDAGSIGHELRAVLSSWASHDFASNDPAVVELAQGGSILRTSKPPARGALLEHRLIGLLHDPSFMQPTTPKEWAKAYKRITTFAHRKRNQLPAKSTVRKAVGAAMVVPTTKPIAKARAVMQLRSAARTAAEEVGGAAFPIEVAETMADYERCLSGRSTSFSVDEAVARRRKVWTRFRNVKSPPPDLQRLSELRGRHRGERIFILGNGPSLNVTDLSLLADEFTFGVNKIHLLFDRIDWRPSFYTLLDWRMGPAMVEPLAGIDGMTRFYPERFRGVLPTTEDTYWYWPRPVGDRLEDQFTTDAVKGIPSRATVLVTAIQLAFHLGFRDIVLIGVDASYTIPASVEQSGPDQFRTGTKLFLESTADDDPNHFDPAYFGAGSRWHDPNVDDMKRMFGRMRKGVERHGGRLRNATVGGRLEVVPRVDFGSLFR